MKQSLKDLKNILKKPGVRKSTLVYPFLHDLQFSQLSTFKHALHSILTEPYIVQKESDLIMCARCVDHSLRLKSLGIIPVSQDCMQCTPETCLPETFALSFSHRVLTAEA
jgi:hypothetical protein